MQRSRLLPLLGHCLCIAWLAGFFAHAANAQEYNRINSPYSRFGFGDVNAQDFTAIQSTGGLNATYNSLYQANPLNPATLGTLRYTSFELAAYYKGAMLNDGTTEATTHDGNMGYLSLAFPITRNFYYAKDSTVKKIKPQIGGTFGIVPHSSVGYDIELQDSLANIGNISYRYTGRGTRYNVYLGTGIKYKRWNLGIKANYLFGKSYNIRQAEFADIDYAYNDYFDEQRNQSGLSGTLGLLYDGLIEEEKSSSVPLTRRQYRHLQLGAYYTSPSVLRSRKQELWGRQFIIGTSIDRDSILFNEDIIVNDVNLPGKFAAGISYSRDFNWMIGAQVEFEPWANATLPNDENADDEEYRNGNTLRIAVGGEYLPNYKAAGKFFALNLYRFGAFYATDHRIINGYQLYRYGVNLGVGIPMQIKSYTSFVNLGIEAGWFGHPELIREQYLRFSLAFTLNDPSWFIRQRFK